MIGKRVVFVLVMILLCFSGCGRVENIPVDTELPVITPETPVSTDIRPTESNLVQTPVSPGEEALVLIEARLHSSSESDSVLINGTGEEYSGYGWISFHFNKLTVDLESVPDMAPFFKLNGEKLDTRNLSSDGNYLNLYLDDSLPENIVVEVLPGLAIDGSVLEQGFSLRLAHYEGLKVTIEPFSTETQTVLPKSIYLAGESWDFLVSFSKPMDQSSVEISLGEGQYYEFEKKWLDDQRIIVHVSGLKLYDYCSIEVKTGKARDGNLFGDRVDPTNREDNDPAIYFYVKQTQRLQAVSLDSQEIRVIATFSQGMLAEDLSPDHTKLSMGVITNDDDGYFYTKCILDLNEKNPELKVTPWRTLYNPPVQREYWTKGGIYASELISNIMSIKSELTENLYGWRDAGRYCRETLKLDNGDITMVQVQHATVSSSDEGIFLVHADRAGKIIKEYQLPFKSKTGEGWILFECDIEDAGNNTILATGYENPPYGPVSTYSINLTDGSIKLIAQTGDLIKRFPELGFSLYFEENPLKLNDYQHIDVIDYSGSVLTKLTLPEEFHVSRPSYNPYDGRLYMFSGGERNVLSWKSFDPETFEETGGTLSWKPFSEPIGFLSSGELLILDSI